MRYLLILLLLAPPLTAQTLQPGESLTATYTVVNNTVAPVTVIPPSAPTLTDTWTPTITPPDPLAPSDWTPTYSPEEQGRVDACGVNGAACSCNSVVPILYLNDGGYPGDANTYVVDRVGDPISNCNAAPPGAALTWVEEHEIRIQQANYELANDLGDRAQ